MYILLQGFNLLFEGVNFRFRLKGEFLLIGLGLISLEFSLFVRMFQVGLVFVQTVVFLTYDTVMLVIFGVHQLFFLPKLKFILRCSHFR